MSLLLGGQISPSAQRVLALVSGMPAKQRLSRVLLVLQAYIDESYTNDALFVMAGYVATVEQWLAFSDEWASLLGLGPPHFRELSELHMAEMTSPLGIEQSELFYRVIERHLRASVSCSIKVSDLHAAFASIEWPDWLDNLDILTSDYYMAFQFIVNGLATEQGKLGLSGPIDIIFDDNSNKAKCLRAWDLQKRIGPESIRSMLGDTPIFRSSHSTMPLQAADLLAYWTRASLIEHDCDSASFELKYPWEMKSKMRRIHLYYEPEMLKRNFRATLLACELARAGVRPDIISALVSPEK